MKLNCWEVRKCGFGPNGEKSIILGCCPVAVNRKSHGINNGTFGGRACWGFPGTQNNGSGPETFAGKISKCITCRFYKKVYNEEGAFFVPSLEIHERIFD